MLLTSSWVRVDNDSARLERMLLVLVLVHFQFNLSPVPFQA